MRKREVVRGQIWTHKSYFDKGETVHLARTLYNALERQGIEVDYLSFSEIAGIATRAVHEAISAINKKKLDGKQPHTTIDPARSIS